MKKTHQRELHEESQHPIAPTFFGCALLLLGLMAAPASAQSGFWHIAKLPMSNAMEPTINNSGEIVWAGSPSGGIFSSVRGKLSDTGIFPHLANSSEVVFADWFGGPYWDLVSTTRGRLTFGGIIDVNTSTFDVNAGGEVVYGTRDSNGYIQIFSTVRNQLTFTDSNHQGPCINDLGEIIWIQYDPGAAIVSTTRGVIPGNFGWLLDLNNLGEFCFSGTLEGPPGFYSFPHVFSSAHGFIIDDPQLFQWNGAINDAGTIVWEAPDEPDGETWHLFKAEWVDGDHTPPEIVRITATPDVLWPPNNRMIPVSLSVDATDNLDPSPIARITQVTSNGPQNTSVSDWEITGPLTVNLRATRSAKAMERVYTIVVECVDASGNASSESVNIRVSPDNKGTH